VPAGVERELLSLQSQDGAWHAAAVYRRVGSKPRHGLVLMHPIGDLMGHYALGPLAEMGYAALGVNSRFAAESDVVMEQCLLDLASGVRYLREHGCETVCLIGNSGGGALSAFYQAQAERPTVTATPAGDAPDLTTADLPKANALVMLNAHLGRPVVATRYLDPAVLDERDPLQIDPSLDMFNPDNGPPYAPEFVERYRAAQEARNRRITRWAQARLETLEQHGLRDEGFVVHRTIAALEMLDPSLDPSGRPIGWYGGPDVQAQNRAGTGIARFNTARTWLSQFGLETSNASTAPNLARVTVPVLIVQGTADEGIYPADAKALREACGSKDTTLHWVTDGSHFFAGQPEIQARTLEFMARWFDERGVGPASAA
jgi:alpha-beta hydrolase superfamily lysophospholipase